MKHKEYSPADYFDRSAEPINPNAQYTYTVNTDSTNYDYSTEVDLSKWMNCKYLLPCGTCERTGKTCPRHVGDRRYDPIVTWTTNDSTTCSCDGTYTTEAHKPTQKDIEDFFTGK